MAPPTPPDLMPELIGEILVRIQPDDPASLVRASLVCKLWRCVLCDPAFRRRYVAFHRAPPLLGFLHNWKPYVLAACRPRFVSTTRPSPLTQQAFVDRGCGEYWAVLDCRHGRVLLKAPDMSCPHGIHSLKLVVMDPVTGMQNCLPEPPFPERMDYTAAVLCAVGSCDHLDCHNGPVLVVFVDFNIRAWGLQSHLYSSEAKTWTSSLYTGVRFLTVRKPSVLIGDDIYFLLVEPSVRILKADMGKNHLSIINLPGPEVRDFKGNVILMAMEDGSLSLAAIRGSKLFLWSRNVMNSEDAGGWAQCRVIELQTMITFKHDLRVVGSKEGSGIIFVASYFGIFSLDVTSACSHGTKVDEPGDYIAIFPFTSFYTPDDSNSKFDYQWDHTNHCWESRSSIWTRS